MGRVKLSQGDWTTPKAKKNEMTGSWRAWCRFGGFDGRTVTMERIRRTKAVAEKKLLEAVMARRDRGRPLGDEATVAQIAEAWLSSIEPPKVEVDGTGNQIPPKTETRIERQTWDQYDGVTSRHIVPALGALKVADIRTSRCESFLHGLIQNGRGHTTARLARTVLEQMLGYAVRHDLLNANPVRDVSRLPKRTKVPDALTEGDLKAVRDAVRHWRTAPGTFGPSNDGILADTVDLLLASGARVGEILALRWEDVDLSGDVGKVSIRGTIIEPRKGPKYRQAYTKTEAGNRIIPVPRFAVDVLLRRSIAAPADTEAVLWSQKNGYRQASSVRRSLRSALTAAGIDKPITPHSFRRTVATMLARELSDGAAAELLGHASVAVTHRSYIERLAEVADYRDVLQKLAAVDRA